MVDDSKGVTERQSVWQNMKRKLFMGVGIADIIWIIFSLSILVVLYFITFGVGGRTAPLLSILGIEEGGCRVVPQKHLMVTVGTIRWIFLFLHNFTSWYGVTRLVGIHEGCGGSRNVGAIVPIVLCIWNIAPEVILYSSEAIQNAILFERDYLSTRILLTTILLPTQTMLQWLISRVIIIFMGDSS